MYVIIYFLGNSLGFWKEERNKIRISRGIQQDLQLFIQTCGRILDFDWNLTIFNN